ncbi:hypothetical protein Ae201684P_004681 [Aphanomyces euteiches]|nr:hypothetical protein Ae201684P_004681 [Aphanomyces euteiches]
MASSSTTEMTWVSWTATSKSAFCLMKRYETPVAKSPESQYWAGHLLAAFQAMRARDGSSRSTLTGDADGSEDAWDVPTRATDDADATNDPKPHKIPRLQRRG